jgi:hypothetical protein
MLLIEPSDLDSNPLVHQEVWRHLAIRFVADIAVAAMPEVAFYEPFSRVHLIASIFAGLITLQRKVNAKDDGDLT